MKYWRYILIAVLLMAISFVQAAGAESSAAGATLIVNISPKAGNTLVVATNIAGAGATNVSITDNAPGGSSSYAFRKGENLGSPEIEIWSTAAGGVSPGVTQVTITFGNTGERAAVCSEYSGVQAIGTNVGNNSGTSTSPTANCTTVENNNWVVGSVGAAALVTYSAIVGNQRGATQGATIGLALIDNTSASPAAVTTGATISSSVTWGVASFELRVLSQPINTPHGATAGSSTAATTSGAIVTTAAVGECIVVAVGTVATTSNAPTDTANNVYVQLGSSVTNTETITFWGCLSNLVANPSVTCTFGSSRWGVAITTFTGVVAFGQQNTTTNTGTTSPCTATLPSALKFALNVSLAAFANKSTGSWSASTGTLCNNIAGAGTTSPGVAIVFSRTTTAAASNTSVTFYAGTIIELYGIVIVDDDATGRLDSYRDWRVTEYEDADTNSAFPIVVTVVPKNGYDDLDSFFKPVEYWDKFQNQSDLDEPGELARPPAVHVPDDLSKFDAAWRVPQYDDLETQAAMDFDLIAARAPAQVPDDLSNWDASWRTFPFVDEESDKSVSAAVVTPNLAEDGLEQKNFDWRGLYDHTSDTDEPGGLGTPAVAIQDDETPRFVGWNAIYDHTSDTDEPGGLALPPYAEPARFSLGADETMIGDVLDFGFSTAPLFEEVDAYRLQAVLYGMVEAWADLDGAALITPPPVVPNIGLDDENLKSVDWIALYDHTLDTDEPGGLASPPFIIQDDETTKFTGIVSLYDHTSDTDEPGGLASPPSAIQDEISEWFSDWRALHYKDTDTASFMDNDFYAPRFFDEAELFRFDASWRVPQQDDTDTAATMDGDFFAPRFFDDLEFWKFDASWFARQYEDSDTPSALLFIVPPAQQDEISERFTDTRAPWHEDVETQRVLPPTPTQSIQEEASEHKLSDWRVTQPEDETFSAVVPQPPAAQIEEISERYVGWQQNFQTEEETQRTDAPTPPPALTEEPIATLPFFVQFDEALAAEKTPPPPIFQQTVGDDLEAQARRSDAVVLPSEMEDVVAVPAPPSSIQEEPIEKYVGWLALQYEDTDTALTTTPPPPFAIQQEDREQKITDWSARQPDDETLRNSPPTSPLTSQEEFSEQKVTDWRAVQPDDDTLSASVPTPPFVAFEESEQKQVDWRATQPEDDTSNAEDNDFLAPVTFQEEPIEKYIGWLALQPEDDSYNVERADSLAPIVQQVEESEQKNVDWKALHEDGVESAKTPPVPSFIEQEGHDDQETMARMSDPRAVYHEEENRFSTPTPPTTQQFEESEQKNIDWQVKQQEDTETQRALAPTPPVVKQFEESEQKNVDWQVKQHDELMTEQQKDADLLAPTTFDSQTEATKFDATWRVLRHDELDELQAKDADLLAPTTYQEEPIEKQVDWTAHQYEDAETTISTAPQPPTAQIDEIAERYSGWQQPWQEDVESQRALPPTPPTTQQEETSERVPAVPVQFDEALATEKTPPPPVSQQTTTDDLEAQFHVALPFSFQIEEDASSFLFTPPFGQPDVFLEQWVDWRQQAVEDDLSSAAPRPPFALQDPVDDSLWCDWQKPLIEEELSTTAPPPPFAVQDAEDTLWRGFSMPLVEDDWLMGTPAPPTAQHDEVVERSLPLTVQFDEVLAAEKTPTPIVPKMSADDVEAHFRINVPSLQPEDDARVPPPSPPDVQQTEDAEQRNVDYLAFQEDATDTASAATPEPPTVQEIDYDAWTDWRSPALEDELTYTAPEPPFVQEDVHDKLAWRGIEFFLDEQLGEPTFFIPPPFHPFAIFPLFGGVIPNLVSFDAFVVLSLEPLEEEIVTNLVASAQLQDSLVAVSGQVVPNLVAKGMAVIGLSASATFRADLVALDAFVVSNLVPLDGGVVY